MNTAVASAAVSALCVAFVLNFLLTLAVMRRLRVHEERRVEEAGLDVPMTGKLAPTFAVETVGGKTIDQTFYDQGAVVVAFFTADCTACDRIKRELQRKPPVEPMLALVQRSALEHHGVTQAGHRQAEFVEELQVIGADVALFPGDSDLLERFQVRAFPTLLKVQAGVVSAAGFRLRDLESAPQRSGPAGLRVKLGLN